MDVTVRGLGSKGPQPAATDQDPGSRPLGLERPSRSSWTDHHPERLQALLHRSVSVLALVALVGIFIPAGHPPAPSTTPRRSAASWSSRPCRPGFGRPCCPRSACAGPTGQADAQETRGWRPAASPWLSIPRNCRAGHQGTGLGQGTRPAGAADHPERPAEAASQTQSSRWSTRPPPFQAALRPTGRPAPGPEPWSRPSRSTPPVPFVHPSSRRPEVMIAIDPGGLARDRPNRSWSPRQPPESGGRSGRPRGRWSPWSRHGRPGRAGRAEAAPRADRAPEPRPAMDRRSALVATGNVRTRSGMTPRRRGWVVEPR